MNETYICICDENITYLQLVQKYLLKRKLNNINIMFFSEIEKAIEASRRDKFFISILNEQLLCKKEKFESLNTDKIWILQETNNNEYTYPVISKYQSMDKILEKILDEIPNDNDKLLLEKKTKILTFFEASKQNKELTGFNVARYLTSLGNNILYLNFSPFIKFDFLTNIEGPDVSDLIFYLLKETNHIEQKIELLQKEKDGVKLFMPAFDYTNLLELTKEEWKKILFSLEKINGYDFVILESDAANQGLLEIYDKSEIFYMNKADKGYEQFSSILNIKEKKNDKLHTYKSEMNFEDWKGELVKNGIIKTGAFL